MLKRKVQDSKRSQLANKQFREKAPALHPHCEQQTVCCAHKPAARQLESRGGTSRPARWMHQQRRGAAFLRSGAPLIVLLVGGSVGLAAIIQRKIDVKACSDTMLSGPEQ